MSIPSRTQALATGRCLRRRGGAIIGICLLAGSLLGCGTASSAIPASAAFLQANQQYAQGDYAQAVRDYRALLAQRGYSVPLLYNLGNAWLRLNQPGRATLNYERAQRLAPFDPAITRNLQLAQRQSGHPATVPTPLERALTWPSLDALAWIGTAAVLTLSVALLMARLRCTHRLPAVRTIAVLSALVFLMSSGLVIRRWSELDRAVILAAATPVRLAPAEAADVSFVLREGDLVQAASPYLDYVLVHTGDGRSGWVQQPQVARVIAPTRDYAETLQGLLSRKSAPMG